MRSAPADEVTAVGPGSIWQSTSTLLMCAMGVYGGNNNYSTSTSSALAQTVNQASTSTSLSSSANPSTYGPITLTATVPSAISGAATPAGSVTLNNPYCPFELSGKPLAD